MARPAALTVEGLKAYYVNEHFGIRREVRAVDDISLTVRRNEVYGIAGESSSGKSSLIKTLAGAIRPPMRVIGGSVTFDFGGRTIDVYAQPEQLKPARWRHLSYIMQGSMNVLNPVRRVKHSFHDFAYRHMGLGRAAFWHKVRQHLERLGLDPDVLEAFPHQLSGGMRQRVAIAIAMLHRPDLIIADEPTTALDVTVQAQIMQLLRDLQASRDMALVLITHDLAMVAEQADDVAVMYAGNVVETGPVAEVFAHPRHPYTKGLLDSVPEHAQRGRPLPAVPGSPPELSAVPPGCVFQARCPLARDRCAEERPALRPVGDSRSAACHFSEELAGV